MLGQARAMVRPALTAALGRLHPDLARMGGYSLGFWDRDGLPTASEGKYVRSAMVLLGSNGVSTPDLPPAAAAIELVHAFSLIHDDVMDADATRHHRAATWKAFGTGPAVLAGDALLATAYVIAGEINPQLVRLLAGTVASMVKGQAEDASFESRPWAGAEAVGVEEYSAMSGRKTSALLACAAQFGGIVGGADAVSVEALRLAAHHLGLAFQATDDILGLWGDTERTGKPALSDLSRGKKTFPVLSALRSRTDAGAELADLLSTGPVEIAYAAKLIEAAGGRQATQLEADSQLRQALTALDQAQLTEQTRRDFRELADFIVRRQA